MCTKKKPGTSNLNCSKKNMRKFFNNEDWKEDSNGTLPTMEGIKRDIESMDFKELKAFKLKTKTNLAKATLQNRNTALEFGVPVASLVFSILAIIVSFYPEEPTTYIASPFFLFFQAIVPINSDNGVSFRTTIFLVLVAIVIVTVLLICRHYCEHKYEIFYYQTLLNVIASNEEEREYSNRYDVAFITPKPEKPSSTMRTFCPKTNKHKKGHHP